MTSQREEHPPEIVRENEPEHGRYEEVEKKTEDPATVFGLRVVRMVAGHVADGVAHDKGAEDADQEGHHHGELVCEKLAASPEGAGNRQGSFEDNGKAGHYTAEGRDKVALPRKAEIRNEEAEGELCAGKETADNGLIYCEEQRVRAGLQKEKDRAPCNKDVGDGEDHAAEPSERHGEAAQRDEKREGDEEDKDGQYASHGGKTLPRT